jgi:hypothetical protein
VLAPLERAALNRRLAEAFDAVLGGAQEQPELAGRAA